MIRIKKILSLITLTLVLINGTYPFVLAQQVLAQEVTLQESTPSAPTESDSIPVSSDLTSVAETTPSVESTFIPSETPAITPAPSTTPNTTEPAPGPQPTPSIWKDLDSKTVETINNVEVSKDYTAPQNDKVKVNFTKLPDPSGKLTIKEIKLSQEQIKELKAASDTAYDITSTMTNGTFTYDLTLPLPEQAKGKKIEIKFAESAEELSKAVNVDEPKEEKANAITIKGLDHFTIFVVTNPAVNAKAVSATIDANNGYPDWYSDNNGIQLTPCLDGSDPKCVLPGAGEEPNFDPKNLTDFPGNFPSEFFYYIAESDIINTPGGGKFMMRFALEGAFLNDDPAPQEQIVFGRIRATGTSLQPNSTYTVTHPYGVDSYETDATGVINRKVGTGDIGCETAPCDFAQALVSRVFDGFLKFDSGAPDGYLGDGVSAKTVTGSKTGNNFVKITGPGLPEGGLTTDKFTVAGKLFTAAPTPPAPDPNPNPNPDPICTNTAPDKPTLKSPQNNIIDTPLAQALSWNPINSFGVNCQGNTNKFEVFLSEGIDPTDSIGEIDANLKDKIVSSLKTSTIYSWKVRAKNGNLFTDSDVWVFTTAAVKPVLRAVSNLLHESGFPSWYSDDNGIKVGPCLDGTDPICVLPGAGEEANWNPDQPTELGINFPSEFFYWIAESDFMTTPNGGKVSVRVALEGAFLNEDPIDGDQTVFGRIRVTGTKFEPNSTYTVTHPYGMDIYQSDDLGTLRRTTSTEDIGCAAAPCDFKAALDSRVFGAFLRWDSGAPDGYLGDAITPHTITGSPAGNNLFKIEGPGLPDGGLSTDLFNVSGSNPNPPIVPIDTDSPVIVNPPVVNPPAPDQDSTGQAPADQKGTITIVEKSLPQDAQDFEFSRSSNGGNFFLDDDSDETLTNQIIMPDLSSREITFREAFVPDGWVLTSIDCTDPNNNSAVDLKTSSANIQLDEGESVTCTFTNTKKGSIAGNLFEDKNGNAVKEAGDLAISQRTVFLDSNDNGLLDSGETRMVTDAFGNYQFSALMPGNINIREVIPQSWFQTLPISGKLAVDLLPGANLTGQDFGSTVYYSIGSGGKFAPIGLTDFVRSLGDSLISIEASGGASVISIPDGTIITRVDGSTFDTAQLSATLPLLTFINGIDTAKFVPVSLLQWGIPNIGLAFSKPITINLFVGQSFNGQTLNIFRSTTGLAGWTTEGLAAPQSCTVLLGICTIQTTLASFFAAAQIVPQVPASTPIPVPTSVNNSSNSSNPSVCADSKPGSTPILLSAVTSGPNQVTLTWSKALDPVSNYSIVYGLASGNPIYGNPNAGGKETTSYAVNGLSGNTAYYFKIKAINGCNGSEYSNELSAAPGGATIQRPAQGFAEGVLGVQTDDGTKMEKPLNEAGILGASVNGAAKSNQGIKTVPLVLSALGFLGFGYYWFFYKKNKNAS